MVVNSSPSRCCGIVSSCTFLLALSEVWRLTLAASSLLPITSPNYTIKLYPINPFSFPFLILSSLSPNLTLTSLLNSREIASLLARYSRSRNDGCKLRKSHPEAEHVSHFCRGATHDVTNDELITWHRRENPLLWHVSWAGAVGPTHLEMLIL